ncbi:Tripartite tricarboxylate transporter TctB family protein [Anaerovirgula multivorans]|uniref:Tripartite tricarboxylate transporter TctB family protein n=1 Tax=Anaerovirgula multivorans TaxID=312168 RepID=A0A239HIK9_9FIRM|nr:tripartite tricarboxylate transporter TctB family protein [Anaerovirgula multivorans]SNS81249.1 Tripartite tricarboxylate transporter TctB family protein [Anaerovirgula multivorans]
METKKLKVGEKVLCYGIGLLSVFILYQASKISGFVPKPSSPGAFPLMVSIALCIFSLGIWGESRKFSPNHFTTLGEYFKAIGELVFTKDIIIMIMFLILYSVLLPRLGFNIATVLFLWSGISYLTSGNWVRNLLIAFLNLGVILLTFKFIFKVILP